MSRDLIQSLQDELREVEFEAQKKRLVDTFYKEVTQVYVLRPDSFDHDQFRINADGKTLLPTLASRYGAGYYRCTAEIALTHRLPIGDIAERSE